jgi:hypothetical protein
VLFPVGALRCLERLRGLARDGLLVLTADRGTAQPSEAVTQARDLELGRHGAVSFPVAFHALRALTARRGGFSLRPRVSHRHVHVAAFVLGTRTSGPFTRAAFERYLAASGPDALYGERRRLASTPAVALRALRSLIRRVGPDPRAIAECVRPLWPHLDSTPRQVRAELRDAVLAAWPNHYDLGDTEDVPFHLALLLYGVRAYADAHRLFTASLRLHGPDASTHWNLGLCAVALGHAAAARRAFHHAHVLAPALHPAGVMTVKTTQLESLSVIGAALSRGRRSPRNA